MKNKKLWVIIAIVALIVIAIFAFSGRRETADDRPVVKIGVIAPLSGSNAVMGQNCKRGIELAISKLSDSPFNYKLISEDDQFIAARSTAAANKLIHSDKASFIITCSATGGAAVAQVTAANKTILIATISSATETATQSKYNFLHWPTPEAEGQKMVELLKSQGVKKAVIFAENHPGSSAIGDGLAARLSKNNIKFARFDFMGTERNFKGIVEKAARENADVFVILALNPAIELLIKALHEKNITTPYTSIEFASFANDPSLFNDVKFVDIYDGDEEVLAEFRKKHDTNNVYGAAFAYDSMMIIDNMLRSFYNDNERLPDSDESAAAILKLKHSGAVGEVEITKDGFIISKPVIKTMRNGVPVMVAE